MKDLIISSLRTVLFGTIALALLLFLPAWTLDYWQAWVFIVVLLGSVNAIGVYLSMNDPALLERRKKIGPTAETTIAQKIIMSVAIFGLLALLVFSAVDHRFGWSRVPPYVSVAGDVLVALGLLIDFIVFKENSFGGSTIQTYEDQKVISTGPYALVRHPMYAGVMVMCIGIPLALGSRWGLAFLALTTLVLMWRILDEERLLEKELPGYRAYTRKVRYRLVPHLW